MDSLSFVLIYVFGGLTFFPTLLCLVLLHAFLTFPRHAASTSSAHSPLELIRDSKDDGQNIKSEKAVASLSEKFQRDYEPDVAAGYFAVCREYVPGGINGKPPERTTPAGSVIVMESPSVYQSMYRSIFDRRQAPSLDSGKSGGKITKRARNVFFVVLRHGHLMLYDDSEQLEVRHVISLEHHDVSIYGGEEKILEGELWIKRNAICLSRKSDVDNGTSVSKPFYLFSENCSEKEDFYFALLQNQEVKSHGSNNPPKPQQYDVKHIIGLVQTLHSSEEQLQTRWINALIGRGFLALYKTQEVEDYIRKKIIKKISRVKKPAFLSGVILQNVDMGESAPYITNPRLKDLTIDGDCCVEADVKYSGSFKLEIAATVRIDLGSRFKAREVNVVLAVVVKKLDGHGLIKFKPPPSNRVWITFETMPEIELLIEPIVSSRQITYNIILRAIESRIREVIAETIVLPHWDDSPFTDTEGQEFRGGIWARNSLPPVLFSGTGEPKEEPENTGEEDDETIPPSTRLRAKDDRTLSMSVLQNTVNGDPSLGKAAGSTKTSTDTLNVGVSSSLEKIGRNERPPKAMRSRSFASAANPIVSLDQVNIDSTHHSIRAKQYHDATSAMMAISNRSQPTSPVETPVGSPQEQSTLLESGNASSTSSSSSKPSGVQEQNPESSSKTPLPTTPTRIGSSSAIPSNGTANYWSQDVQQNKWSSERRQATIALGAATAAAKKWGWSVLSRNNEHLDPLDQVLETEKAGTPEYPIGRGRPLPPPGQPLPFPERPSSKVSQNSLLKRKTLPPPTLPKRQQAKTKPRPVPVPPLPHRRRQHSKSDVIEGNDGLMVVEAPPDSEPTSPLGDGRDVQVGYLKRESSDETTTTPILLDRKHQVRGDCRNVVSSSSDDNPSAT